MTSLDELIPHLISPEYYCEIELVYPVWQGESTFEKNEFLEEEYTKDKVIQLLYGWEQVGYTYVGIGVTKGEVTIVMSFGPIALYIRLTPQEPS